MAAQLRLAQLRDLLVEAPARALVVREDARLRLEVEPTFLLDVARVFVPTLAGGGGEAPELVLPDDIRMTPGETRVLLGILAKATTLNNWTIEIRVVTDSPAHPRINSLVEASGNVSTSGWT